jgi:hypothetical protein
MLKMFQNVMLGETNTKVFKDVTINEGLFLLANYWCFILLRIVSKTN